MKIYTKTGDDGSTALFDGSRVSKDDLRVSAYGDVDELNCVIGMARAQSTDTEITTWLVQMQRDLFALGAQLANPKHKKQKDKSEFGPDKVTALEKIIDKIEAQVDPLTGFILPGGAPVSATLELARTVCRRAERATIYLARTQTVDPLHIQYLNRLSDCFFMLARLANKRLGVKDLPWL